MTPQQTERATRLLADFDSEVAAAQRKRNDRADAVTLVMARFAKEATDLLRELGENR
jgi:hypothetical protein